MIIKRKCFSSSTSIKTMFKNWKKNVEEVDARVEEWINNAQNIEIVSITSSSSHATIFTTTVWYTEK